MPRIARLHHVHRIDSAYNRTHCWRVQVCRRYRIVLRHFSDARFGGKRRALEAAIAFRDATLRSIPDAIRPQWWRTKRRRNNTSGVIGVGRYVSIEESRGKLIERISWQAFWDDQKGKRRSRKFSVKRHGEQRARKLACQAREAAMRAILASAT